MLDDFRMDRNFFDVRSLNDPSDEKGFWLSRSPFQRLEVVEILRQLNYGYDPTTARLQRVLEVAQLASG